MRTRGNRTMPFSWRLYCVALLGCFAFPVQAGTPALTSRASQQSLPQTPPGRICSSVTSGLSPSSGLDCDGAPGGCGLVLAGVAVLAGTVLVVVAQPPPAAPHQEDSAARPIAAARQGCKRVYLTRRPTWSTSAVWKNDELLVVDQVFNKVLRYSATGRSLGTMPDSVETSLEAFFPISVRSRDSDLLFQLTTRQVAAVDKNYLPLARNDFHSDVPSTVSARSLWQWEPLGREIISFSDINTGDLRNIKDWKAAYLRFSLDDPSNATVLEEFPYDHPVRLYNRVGGPYIAVLGDSAFILRVDDSRIYQEHHGSLQPTPVVLPEMSSPPDLPAFYNRDDIVPVMAAVENSTMPMGLYAWHDFLYVVERVVNSNASQWKVVTISPSSFEILGTATVPTPASHLLVVPGPSEWAFIEKGPVKGWGDQSIDSIFFVPAQKLTKNLSGDLCD
jgi:hypothetical protein